MLITKARAENYKVLAKLLFMSGPVNLISLLTGHLVTLDQHQKQKICLEFLETALQHPNGQFGFNNQTVVCKNDILCACVSYWQAPIKDQFKRQTLASLLEHFGALETAAILNNSEDLSHLVQAPSSDDLCIGHLAVAPSFRRQGIATHLLTHCAEVAQKLGKSNLILDVMADNQEAYQTYLRFGFSQKFISHPSSEGQKIGFSPHIHMQKRLVV